MENIDSIIETMKREKRSSYQKKYYSDNSNQYKYYAHEKKRKEMLKKIDHLKSQEDESALKKYLNKHQQFIDLYITQSLSNPFQKECDLRKKAKRDEMIKIYTKSKETIDNNEEITKAILDKIPELIKDRNEKP